MKQKGRKLKRRIDNSKAPMTILWGRDGWEKFLALCIFSLSLGFQCLGLFGSVGPVAVTYAYFMGS